nr:hypothetical protein Itr_chr02CG18720 [Ipomoea trifida]
MALFILDLHHATLQYTGGQNKDRPTCDRDILALGARIL